MSPWVLVPLILAANPFNNTFDRATEAYGAGDYAVAVRLYEQLVGEGVADASVFYNLGNAYAQSGRLGAAIANYERALQQAPSFDDAARNLRKCVGDTERHLERPSPAAWSERAFFWQAALPPGASRRLALVAWFALWLLLGVRLFFPLRYLRRGAAAAGVLALVFGVAAWTRAHPEPLAVIDRDHTAVRAEPNHGAEPRHRFHEGDRVRIVNSEGGWALVETALGERGWVRASDLIPVGPPYVRAHATPQQDRAARSDFPNPGPRHRPPFPETLT